MKVNSEECEALQTSGVHHLTPPSLPHSKSDLEVMAGDSMYSPTRKSSKSEAMSRVHYIPILLLLVFFVLWAASLEVEPDLRIATTTKFVRSEVHQKMIYNEIALPGSRKVLFQVESSHSKQVDPSLRKTAQGGGLPPKSYTRGNARSGAR